MPNIRQYTTDDYSDGRKLWVYLTEHHRTIYDAQTIGGDDPGSGFDDHLERHGHELVWVAQDEETIVGLAGLIVDESSAEIEPVIVHPDWRGRGIGRALVSMLESETRSLGLLQLKVRVVGRNTSAIEFYKAAGLKTVGMVELFTLFDTDREWRPGATIGGVDLDV